MHNMKKQAKNGSLQAGTSDLKETVFICIKTHLYHFLRRLFRADVRNVNFHSIQIVIQGQSGSAPFYHIICPKSVCYIPAQAILERGLTTYQGNAMQLHMLQGKAGQNAVYDCLLMHHPTKNNVIISRAANKIVQ